MNSLVSFVLTSSLILVSLVGICAAEQSNNFLVHIQGGESAIINGSDGMMLITVQDVSSNITVTNGDTSNQTSIRKLAQFKFPAVAAVVLSINARESTSLIEVSNLSIYNGNNSLTLQARPLEYYDGERLKSFAANQTELKETTGRNITATQLFIEANIPIVNNNAPNCIYCIPAGYTNLLCIGESCYWCKGSLGNDCVESYLCCDQ